MKLLIVTSFPTLKASPVWKGRSFDQYQPHGNEPAGYAVWNDVLTFAQQKRMRSRVFKRMFSTEVLADPNTHPMNHCRIAFRDVTRSTDSRTVRACLVPTASAVDEQRTILGGCRVAATISSEFAWRAEQHSF